MRKLKLLFAACALFAGAAWADTSLLTEASGWQKITSISQGEIANNYYVFVANDADLMLGIANSTLQENNALFYQTSVDPVTDVTKVFYLEVNGENYAMRNVKVDYLQFQTEWSNSSNDLRWRNNDQRESISWTGLGLNYADGAWTLTSTQYNRPLGIYNNGTGTPTAGNEIGANNAGNGQKFQIYAISRQQFAKLMGAGATAESPKDLSALIFNSDFENTAKTKDYGWTASTKTGGNYNFNGAVEAWHYGAYDLHQTLKVPNGIYRVTVQALSSTSAYVYAGESKTYVTQATSGNFAEEKNSIANNASYGLIAAETTVTNGQLTFGIADPNNGNAWLVFDNFKLYYKGIDLTILKDAYSTAKVAAQAIDQNAIMQSSILTALQNAISTYSTVEETEEALEAASEALQTAADNATASIAAYASTKAYLDRIYGYLNGENTFTNFYTKDAYNTYYADIKAKYDARTLTTEEGSVLNAEVAYQSGTDWHALNNLDNIMLSVWKQDGTQSNEFDTGLHLNTWSTEGNTDGSEFYAPFYEYWTESKNVLAASTMTATITGLKANETYSVTIRARVQPTDNKEMIANAITMKVGDGDAVCISGGAKYGNTAYYIGNFSAVGKTDSEGNLVATITVAENSYVSWLAFYNVRYTEGEDLSAYIADYEFALNTAKTNSTSEAYTNITGKERADLTAALTNYGEVSRTDKTALLNATTALNEAANTFVQAASAYNAFAELNTTVAAKLNVTLPTITNETTAADLKVNDYIVAEYTAAKAYTEDYTGKLAAWTNAPGTNNGESWDGSTGDGADTYYDLYNSSDRAMTQTVVLPAGDYALIAKGRASVNGLLTLTDGTETVTFAHKSSVGRGIATDGTATFADDATYANNAGRGWEYRVLTFTSDGDNATTLTFNWKTASNNWVGLDDIELRAIPATLDYTALQTAYSGVTVPANLGFEKDECAPYVNAANFENIAKAKDMLDNSSATSQSKINTLAVALTSMTWTANTEDEINAIYNPTFALSNNDGTLVGWSSNDGSVIGNEMGIQHSRAFVLTDGMTNYEQLAAFSQGDTRSAAYFRFDGTNSTRNTQYIYGATAGYTMPLKAGVYRFTAQVGGWGNTTPVKVAVTDNSGTEIASQTINFSDENKISDNNKTAKDVNFLITIPTAAEYRLVLSNGNASANCAIAISNLELKKAVADNVTIDKADTEAPAANEYANVTVNRPLNAGWNAICLPFAVTAADVAAKFGADSEVAEFAGDETNGDVVKLKFKKYTEGLEAGKPYLLYVASAIASVTFEGVAVTTPAAQTVEGTAFNFVGNYTRVESGSSPIEAGDYIVATDGKLHPTNGGNAINGYRAYFKKVTTDAVRTVSLIFDDDTTVTAIQTVTAGQDAFNGVYNLQGQRVNAATKGLYIKDGKKVVLK